MTVACKTDKTCVAGVSEWRGVERSECLQVEEVDKKFNCRYCYQTLDESHVCRIRRSCNAYRYNEHWVEAVRMWKETCYYCPPCFVEVCHVKEEVICMGPRAFVKKVPCNWTSGHRWSTTMILSVTLGERTLSGRGKEAFG